MTLVEALEEACDLLRDGASPVTIASHWGAVDDQAARLLVVRPAVSPWELVQVVVDERGRADEVVFDLPDGAEVPVDGLIAAFGEPEEEDAFDGPIVLWFNPPALKGCRISAWLRRRVGARMTRRLSAVAPAHNQLD